jgi:endonuclease III related protein
MAKTHSTIAHSTIAQSMFELYRSLRRHFGYTAGWWPGTPLEIAISAILVQQCGWHAAARGIAGLACAGVNSLQSLAECDPKTVRECIAGVAFAPTKAPRLVAFAQTLLDAGYHDISAYLAAAPTAQRRRDLLAVKGVGEETADCILLFAGEHPLFVIDSYTRRIFARLGRFARHPANGWLKQPYRTVQAFLQDNILSNLSMYDEFDFSPEVPREVALLRDWHAQLVELGKHHCVRGAPRCRRPGAVGWPDYPPCDRHCRPDACGMCPLVGECRTGKCAG